MRITLHNPYFWPEVRRGSERVLDDLAKGLTAEGFTPTVVVGAPLAQRGQTSEDGYDVSRVARLGAQPLRRLGFHEPVGHLPFAARALRRLDPDLVHSFYPTDAAMAGRWAAKRERPSVFSLMGLPTREAMEDRHARRAIMRSAFSSADAVVVLSESVRTRLAWLELDLEVIHPGVNLDLFQASGDPRSTDPTILCPAALDDPRKRIGFLLEAFALLRERVPEARLVLSKPSRNSAILTRATAQPGVELEVLDDRSRLVKAYSESWLTVLPSKDEAFGLVLAESLACGTPVIGTSEGGAAEIVGDATYGALLDSAAGAQELADLMEATIPLAENEETHALAREAAVRFSSDRSVRAHIDLYRRLADG